ncbi:MAG: DnaD domain protein [Bacilli bacterium]|nr:DnaD domain protein [Bacilli bacterium]
MKDVGNSDFYEVKKMGLVSDVDRMSLVDLYSPLIGAKAVGVYLALLLDPTLDGALLTHDKLFRRLDLKAGEFFQAIEPLEACGLVRTYFKESEEARFFVYCTYCPKDPREFFDDVLFVGTLRKRIGEKAFNELVEKYSPSAPVEGFEEVTTTFKNYFEPDFNDPAYNGKVSYDALGHKIDHIKTDFNLTEFIEELHKLDINEHNLSKGEMRRVEKFAVLYSLGGETVAQALCRNFKPSAPMGKRVDFLSFDEECRHLAEFPYLKKAEEGEKSDVSSNTPIAQLIRKMDDLTPVNFLTALQNGHKPVASDLKIIESLRTELGLPAPVINALLSYVLQTNDNLLNRSLCEKIGASLAREDVKNARDAMDYLLKTQKRSSGKATKTYAKKTYVKKEKEAVVEEKPTVEAKKEETVTDEEIDSLLADLYN